MTKLFNVWSEFQPLEQIVVGNINPIDEINIPFLGQEHVDNLKKVIEYTHNDLHKIKESCSKLNIVVEQCKTYDLRSEQASAPPLQPRDWFMIYGDTSIIPTQIRDYDHNKTKSLDHVLTYNIERGDYTDTANFLRCGNDIFYCNDYNSQCTSKGNEFVINTLKNINPNLRIHKVKNANGHLDGCIFFVKPGLLLSALPKVDLPDCLQKWDIIDCTVPEAQKLKNVNVWGNLFKHKHKKFHPYIIEQWLWYKNTNPEETCWSINALSINEKCVLMPGYNQYVFSELSKRGVECIDLDLQSLDFWDGGLHCMTNELKRKGECIDYFS